MDSAIDSLSIELIFGAWTATLLISQLTLVESRRIGGIDSSQGIVHYTFVGFLFGVRSTFNILALSIIGHAVLL
jgi:hypothetical protein